MSKLVKKVLGVGLLVLIALAVLLPATTLKANDPYEHSTGYVADDTTGIPVGGPPVPPPIPEPTLPPPPID